MPPDIMHFSHRAGIYLSLFATISLPAVQGQTPPSREAATPMQTQVKPPAKDKFLVYLLMGQSNMAGRGSITSEDQEASPRILSMKPDGQWVQAKDPLHQQVGRTKPGIGPGMSFANQMLKADP